MKYLFLIFLFLFFGCSPKIDNNIPVNTLKQHKTKPLKQKKPQKPKKDIKCSFNKC